MKKTIGAGIMLIATLAVARPAAAADTEVSLGLKLWSNTWEETVKSTDGITRKYKNGTDLMAGPSLSVRLWKDYFVNASYLTAFGDYASPSWIVSGDQMKFERTDMDVQAGYLLQDAFNDIVVGFFAAYKALDAPASYTNATAGLNDVSVGTWKLWGPGGGVIVEKHLDKTTVLSGNIGLFFLEQEFAYTSGSTSRFNTSGMAMEVGVAHTFPHAITVDVGIKFQQFKGDKNNGDNIKDLFYGLSGGVAYTF